MPNEKFSDLAHRIRHYQDDLAKQAKELSDLRSELARLKLASFAEAKENRSIRCSERAWRVDEFLDKWAAKV